MSKRIKTLIIIGIVVLLLAGATAVLLLMPSGEGEETDSGSAASFITFADQETDLLESAHIKNTEDEFTIERVGENLWRIRALEDFPINESTYYSARNSLCTLSAMEVVEENSQRLAEYGLTSPQAEVETKFLDGTSYKIALGNLSPDGTRRYALRVDEGNNTVYGLSTYSLSCAFLTRNDFVDTSLIPSWTAPEGSESTVPEVNRLEITGNYLDKPIVIEPILEDDPDVLSSMDMLKMTSPVTSLLNTDWLDKNITALFGVSAEKTVQVAPTEADLEKYGLAEPFMTYALQYDKTSSFKLLVGNGIDSEGNVPVSSKDIVSYYVMREGTDVVYQARKEALPWVNVQPRNVISTLITLPNISTIRQVRLTLDGQEHVLDVTQPPEDSTGTSEMSFTLDGKETDSEMSRKFYQVLLSTSIQDINTAEVSGAPTMSIVYDRTGGSSIQVDFYVQPDLTTIVAYNGNASYIGRSGMIDKVRKELTHLQNGETVDTDW